MKIDQPIRAGILGATGAVGQKFVELLDGHPWFEVAALAASERSAGRPYREAAQWIGTSAIPDALADAEVRPATPDALAGACDFVFSGLDSSVAGEIEADFARAGLPVISNAKNYRLNDDVPLLIPEVNPDHRALIDRQDWGAEGGFIVTNPNCSTVGLVCALHPLAQAFGVEQVQVTTLQALSGAGYPGVASLDALGNVVPYIGGEEEKMTSEPRKLLGTLNDGHVRPAEITLSAQCNRVPVLDGHIECVSVNLAEDASAGDVRSAFRAFESPVADLPTAPDPLLHVFEEDAFPQPRRHVERGGGMTVSIGRVRPCEVSDVKFVALSHNTVRGAAGGAILNAELLAREDYLAPRSAQTTEPAAA